MEEKTSTQENNEEMAKNLEMAKNEIEAIIKKYNVVLVPVVLHQGDKTYSRIDISHAQEAVESVQP